MEHLSTSSRGQDVFHIGLTPPYSLDRPPFDGSDFVVLIINNDPKIAPEVQYTLSLALVRAGCRYAVCMGHDCSSWDDSVDWAYLEVNVDSNDDTFLITTWHENDSPDEIANFFLNCTSFDNNIFNNFLVLSVGCNDPLLSILKREFTLA